MGLSIIYLNPESWSGTVLNRKVVPFFTGAEILYKEWTGIYTINGKTITIDFGDGDIISGVIEGNKMNFAYDGEIIVFTKQ
ncbi:MAG: hypothetical protein K0B11_16540 [Mariniphaga sp.]|nr:hypothetical protein [Mariniphaga sp.]